MNRPQADLRLDKGKILAAILLLLIVGYVYGRPTLERWIGRPLPELGSREPAKETPGGRPAEDAPPAVARPAASQQDRERRSRQSAETQSTSVRGNGSSSPPAGSIRGQNAASKDGNAGPADPRHSGFFERLSRQQYRSPAGLVYGTGPYGEHRIDHVLLHARDDPSRPVHGVFLGSPEEIFAVIDEAWKLAGRGGRNVQKQAGDDGRTEYTIRLNRETGYIGGSRGRADGFPRVNRLRIVIQGTAEVVTAYPVR